MTVERTFTVGDYLRIAPDLSAGERLAVWLGLPAHLRDEAWAGIAERFDRYTAALFAESRVGGSCTPEELAAEIALVGTECAKVPLGGTVTAASSSRAPARSEDRPGRRSSNGDLDALRSIPSAEYVPLLTGREVDRAGFVTCPFHEERTPSLHVSAGDGRWHCFGCQRGGDVFDFFAELTGRGVPTGAEFFELVRDVAIALGAGC